MDRPSADAKLIARAIEQGCKLIAKAIEASNKKFEDVLRKGGDAGCMQIEQGAAVESVSLLEEENDQI